MQLPIPTLRGTPTHITAVELYEGHHGGAAGVCVRCGQRAPCPVRVFAASVIAAAGEDPRWYDGRLSPPVPAPTGPQPAPQPDLGHTYPDHTGYRVGGRDVPMDPAGFLYERDQ